MSATSLASWLGSGARGCSCGARKSDGTGAPMVELSQSLSDMPARRAAASARSRTDGSMPSALHDTREFMLSSGSNPLAHPAPTAIPRVPHERQSNSTRVVCLRHRPFRVTVNNGLRSEAAGPKNWRWGGPHLHQRTDKQVVAAGLPGSLSRRIGSKVFLEPGLLRCKKLHKRSAQAVPEMTHDGDLQSPRGRRRLPAQ